jgi:tetratricopeptide (TPR) repeat protein
MVKAYLGFALDNSLTGTKKLLLELYLRDTNRIDVIKELGNVSYYMRDYPESYRYYSKMNWLRDTYGLDLYESENAKIALVMNQVGEPELSFEYFNKYLAYAEQDESIYKNLSLSVYHSYHGNIQKSLEHLGQFSKETNFQYLLIPFLEIDPLVDNIKDEPDFREHMRIMRLNFWRSHEEIKTRLSKKNLLNLE